MTLVFIMVVAVSWLQGTTGKKKVLALWSLRSSLSQSLEWGTLRQARLSATEQISTKQFWTKKQKTNKKTRKNVTDMQLCWEDKKLIRFSFIHFLFFFLQLFIFILKYLALISATKIVLGFYQCFSNGQS